MYTFSFIEALQWINFGEVVGIKIDGKTRVYFRDKDGDIKCKVNNTVYKVESFYLDAIESNKWVLFEDAANSVYDLCFDVDDATI